LFTPRLGYLALDGFLRPLHALAFALLGRALPNVGHPLPIVGDFFAIVRGVVAFVGYAVAFVGAVRAFCAVRERPVQVAPAVGQFGRETSVVGRVRVRFWVGQLITSDGNATPEDAKDLILGSLATGAQGQRPTSEPYCGQ
jgi:hypothetical protein